jgi:hypothetical protein
LSLLVASPALAKKSSRLSAIVSFLSNKPPINHWLENPVNHSSVQAYVLFPPNTGNVVIFGIDQEFLDGTHNPLFIKGGDWMGLVGIQRTGIVWVARGTRNTMRGIPSKKRSWKIIPLGISLKPNTWYRMRTVIDFKSRRHVSFTINGPGIHRTLNLKAYTLDYPNYMPFDQRALTVPFARSGKKVVVCDATLKRSSYKKWFKSW